MLGHIIKERPLKRQCLDLPTAWGLIPGDVFMEIFENLHKALEQVRDILPQICLVCCHWTKCSTDLKLRLANVHRASMYNLFGHNQWGMQRFMQQHSSSLLCLNISPERNRCMDISAITFANLQTLIIERSSLSDWVWMTKLSTLTNLRLTFDFGAVSAMPALVNGLTYHFIENLAKMSSLTSLEAGSLNPYVNKFLNKLTNLIALKTFNFQLDLDNNTLHALPAFRQLSCLELDLHKVKDRDLFINLTTLTNLVDLYIEDESGYTDLQFIEHLVNLQSLKIDGTETFTDRELKFFSVLTNLQSLDLCGWDLEGYGFELLKPLTALNSLNLKACSEVYLKYLVSLTSLEAFECHSICEADLPLLSSLTSLEQLDLTGIGQAADWRFLNQLSYLEKLSLCASTLSADAFENMVSARCLNSLEILECEFDEENFAKLNVLPELAEIRILAGYLGWSFFSQPFLFNLLSLNLSNSIAESIDGKTFSSMTNLTRLTLDNAPLIGDESILNLAMLTDLKSLSLRNCSVSDEALLNLTSLTNLTHLDVTAPSVARVALQTAFRYVHHLTIISYFN